MRSYDIFSKIEWSRRTREIHEDLIKFVLSVSVADGANKRIQIFSPEGDFLRMWTGMGGPHDITRGKDGNFYIAEQEDGKTAASPRRSASAMDEDQCSSASTAAMTTASTRLAISTPD